MSNLRPSDSFTGPKTRIDEIRTAYTPSGSAKAQIRRNQLLPLHWRHLTPGDISEISKLLWATPGSDITSLELEAMLAIAAILTTGRNLGRLHHLKLYKNGKALSRDGAREGIVNMDGNLFWHVMAGSPSRQGEVTGMPPQEGSQGPDGASADDGTRKSEPKKMVYRKVEHARAHPAGDNKDDRPIKIPLAPVVLVALDRRGVGVSNKPTSLFRH